MCRTGNSVIQSFPIIPYHLNFRRPLMYCAFIPSPVGKLLLEGSDREYVEAISFTHNKEVQLPPGAVETGDGFPEARRQLDEYFLGKRQNFDFPVRLHVKGFRRQVLERLKQVPYGETISYKALGTSIGKPQAARAVGGAVGSNPLSIVIPCHRVLTSAGGIGGFGGGLAAKRTLLRIEGITLAQRT